MENGHITEFELYDLIDGTIPKSEEKILRQHLKQCTACLKLYDYEMLVQKQMESFVIEQPSLQFTDQLLDKLKVEMVWQDAPALKVKKSGANILKWGIITFSTLGLMLLLLVFSSAGSIGTLDLSPSKWFGGLKTVLDNSLLINASIVLYGMLALVLVDRLVLKKYFPQATA